MRHRLQLWLVLIAWFLATGAQWDLTQVFAWGRMLSGYVNEMPLAAAVTKTFTGESCQLCRTVQKAKQEHDGSGSTTTAPAKAGKVSELYAVAAGVVAFAPGRTIEGRIAPAPASTGRARRAPPTPPPRGHA